jgi:hypothetical protein
MQFDKALMEKVCEAVTEGRNILEVCDSPGYPRYAQLINWIRTNDEAAMMMDDASQAMQVRMAETLRFIGAEAPDSKLDAAGKKLHSENMRWLLEREASHKYGNKMQLDVSGTLNLKTALENAKMRLGMEARPVIDVEPTPPESMAAIDTRLPVVNIDDDIDPMS